MVEYVMELKSSLQDFFFEDFLIQNLFEYVMILGFLAKTQLLYKAVHVIVKCSVIIVILQLYHNVDTEFILLNYNLINSLTHVHKSFNSHKFT